MPDGPFVDDWIRVRAKLLDSPKLIGMANFLMIDREFMDWIGDPIRSRCKESVTELLRYEALLGVTLACVLRVWCNANEHTDGGFYPQLVIANLDDIAGVPSIGLAMESVGWAQEQDDPCGVTLPDFGDYNSTKRERRAMTGAERARRFRERRRETPTQNPRNEVTKNVTPNVTDGNDSKSKSKSKSSGSAKALPQATTTTVVLPFVEPDFVTVWGEWVAYRKEKRQSLTSLTIKRQLKKLGEFGHDAAIESIEQSIRNGWVGLFDSRGPKPRSGGPGQGRSESDRGQFAEDLPDAPML